MFLVNMTFTSGLLGIEPRIAKAFDFNGFDRKNGRDVYNVRAQHSA
jgi:hypothetical protein